MEFSDGDEVIGPNSYMRINGAWVKFAGNGTEALTDGQVNRLLTITVPVTRLGTSKTTKETTSVTKMQAYYIYKESE